jgi:hypothetical protein
MMRGSTPDRSDGDDSRQRLQIVALHEVFAGDDHGGGAVGNAGRIARGDRPGFRKHGRELSEFFHACVREGMLVAAERGCAFLAFDGDRREFVVESSGGNGASGAGLRQERIFILLVA